MYGVIFLFKYPSADQQKTFHVAGKVDEDAAERLFFAAQTIQNACGTQALLSILLNHEDHIELGTELRAFKDFTRVFPSQVLSSRDETRY